MKISRMVSFMGRTHGTCRNGYVQTVITSKEGKPELWFMYSAHCLQVLYTDVKFCENISNGISNGADTKL